MSFSPPLPADGSKAHKISVHQLGKRAIRFTALNTKKNLSFLLFFVTREEDIADVPDNEISENTVFLIRVYVKEIGSYLSSTGMPRLAKQAVNQDAIC